LTMPLMLALLGVVIDGSLLFVERRAVQNAADAAALAAAADLRDAADPACDATCVAAVKAKASATAASYSARNGGPAALTECHAASDTNCFTWPYDSDNGRLEVRVRKTVPGVFANVLGSSFAVSARAVASATPQIQTNPGVPIAIFAYTHNGADPCGDPNGITINGNPQTAIDAVLSNGTVTMNSSGTVGWIGYGPPVRDCPKTGTAQGNAPTWAKQAALNDWPRKYDRAAVCAGHDSNVARTLTDPADGIYCSTVGITARSLGGGKTYNVTLVAPTITIPNSSNHFTLAPYNLGLDAANQDLVIWQYGAGQDLSFDHNNSAVNGVIWIENGNLTYVGNSGATGFYEAQSVSITGNSYLMHGSGPPQGGSTQITGVTPALAE
jgi:Flp pilus assembly protein TadG